MQSCDEKAARNKEEKVTCNVIVYLASSVSGLLLIQCCLDIRAADHRQLFIGDADLWWDILEIRTRPHVKRRQRELSMNYVLENCA